MHLNLRAGQTVGGGRYRLVRQIGRGSFGDVYLADQLGPDGAATGPAVLKVLHPQWAQVPQVVERFRRESEVTRRIEHPNVARIFESGQIEGGVPFIAMEYLPGPSLREELVRGPLPFTRGSAIVTGICDALSAAHRAGVVHRDLKPENIILVARDGRPDHPVVLDFGVAKFLDAAERLTMTGAVLGTPTYMPPEQFRGENDLGPPADVYALGVLAFEVFSGRPPFTGKSFADLAIAHTTQAAPPLSGVQRAVAEVVARCLDKDPAKRPRAEALAAALNPAGRRGPSSGPAQDTLVDTLPPTVVSDGGAINLATVVSAATLRERQDALRRRLLAALLGLAGTLFVAAIVLLVYFLLRRS